MVGGQDCLFKDGDGGWGSKNMENMRRVGSAQSWPGVNGCTFPHPKAVL